MTAPQTYPPALDARTDTVEASRAEGDGHGATGALGAVRVDVSDASWLPGLDPASAQVLTSAVAVIGSRQRLELDGDVVLMDRAKLEVVLDLLTRSSGLRKLTAAQLGADGSGSVGGVTADAGLLPSLLQADPQAGAAAAAELRAKLDEARKRAKTSRRAARRAARPDAATKAEDRTRQREQELRQARDKHSRRASTLEQTVTQLREQLGEVQEALADTTRQLEAAHARAATATAAGVPTLAARLAGLLAPRARAHAVTEPGQRPADAPLVDPARRDTAPALDASTLTRLARAAGLGLDEASRALEWLPRLLSLIANPPREHIQTFERNVAVDVLGAYDEVAGSAVLLSAGDTRVLVDAGTRAGDGGGPKRIAEALTGRLDAIIVTHAHIDHAGWVPAVLAERPDVPVYTTDATATLLETMLTDSVTVLRKRARESGTTAPYGLPEVNSTLAATRTLDFGQQVRIGDLDVELFPAGHIVGAASVLAHAGNRRIVVTGDVSGPGQLTVGGWELPEAAKRADLLVMESTYGAQDVTPRVRSVEAFVRTVTGIVEGGGRVLVPSFALGRAQEIAMLMSTHLPNVPVLIDGLARDVSRVYDGRPGPDGAALRVFSPQVRAVARGGTSEEIRRFRSGVIIATSGMMTGGPAVSWARSILPDPNDAVLVVGYQDAAAPGRRLQDLARDGSGAFELPGQPGQDPVSVAVNAHVDTFHLGAHASAQQLLRLSAEATPERLMLVHGDLGAQREMRKRLHGRNQTMVRNDEVLRLR